MNRSKRVMRRMILSRLYDHLQDHYAVFSPREHFVDGNLTMHDIDALLAFKSDPQLDELRHALDRLESGTFGICLGCKAPIPQALLDNDPSRRICISCEQKFLHVTTERYVRHAMTT